MSLFHAAFFSGAVGHPSFPSLTESPPPPPSPPAESLPILKPKTYRGRVLCDLSFFFKHMIYMLNVVRRALMLFVVTSAFRIPLPNGSLDGLTPSSDAGSGSELSTPRDSGELRQAGVRVEMCASGDSVSSSAGSGRGGDGGATAERPGALGALAGGRRVLGGGIGGVGVEGTAGVAAGGVVEGATAGTGAGARAGRDSAAAR